MASADQLEALIKLESDLKSQYEKKLTAERYKTEEQLEAKAKLQSTIAQQASEISALKAGGTDLKRLEQENRELKNRSENIKNEFDSMRSKAKAAAKEMVDLKAELKQLKQLDARKIKKNLVETKKKLEEQRTANDLLKKNTNKYKLENSEYMATIAKLEAELEALKGDSSEEAEAVEQEQEAEPLRAVEA